MNYQREMGAYFDAYNKNTTANRDNSCTHVLIFLTLNDEEFQLRSSPHEWNRLHLSDWTMPNSSRTQCTVFKRSILSNLIFSPEPSGMVANQRGNIPMRNFGTVDTSPSVLVRTLEVLNQTEKINQGPINRPLKSPIKCRGSMSSRRNSSTSLVSFSSLSFLRKKL